MTKQKKDVTQAWPSSLFFLLETRLPSLVAYIPINYTTLISEIKNIPGKRPQGKTEVGEEGDGLLLMRSSVSEAADKVENTER